MRSEVGNPRGDGNDTAVIVHVYYPEMWGQISGLLANIETPFDLFVTVPTDVDFPDSTVTSVYPDAAIRRHENRGRDIAPFVSVLSEISQAGYAYVCKLHTKKSLHTRHGARWCHEMFDALVGSKPGVSRIRAAFREHPDWGLIAPAGHVVPHLHCWSENVTQVLALATSVGIPTDDLDFTFAAGSMFWFRPEALSLLNDSGLTSESFEPEQHQIDGTMAHAVERFIGLAVQHAGFTIAECDSHSVRPSHVSLQFRMLVENLAVALRDPSDGTSGEGTGSGTSETEQTLTNTVTPPPVSIQALTNAHAGDTAWIVGKGPSLLMLTKEQLGPGPVIAINEAMILVEALGLDNVLYSMQKDADRYEDGPGPPVVVTGGTEPIAPLKGATLLVHQHESANRMIEYQPRFVFDNVADFGLEWWEFSSLTAVAIARLMGCLKVVFVSHDACVFGDLRTCTPRPDGSVQVQTDEVTAVTYPQHRQRIDEYLSRVSMDAEWLTPEVEYAQHKRLTDELARAEYLYGELEESRAALRGELDATLHELQAVTTSLASAEDRVSALLGSTSWRWTAPFRAAHDLLARIRSRRTGT